MEESRVGCKENKLRTHLNRVVGDGCDGEPKVELDYGPGQHESSAR